MSVAIFIAGPSASGKSTLAKAIAALKGVRSLSLDDYFIRGAKAFVETATGKVRTFERPQLYDGVRLARDIATHREPIVAEGFCLFAYPEIQALPALRFYLHTPFSVCLARRNARRPQRPSDKSFQIIGESEFTAFVAPQQYLPSVTVLDGMLDTSALVQQVIAAAATAGYPNFGE